MGSIGKRDGAAWDSEINATTRSLKVLVVDDNSINQRGARLFLDKLACQTECVSSGRSCLQKLEESNYDVILMDMEMPEMSGCEATHEIRKLPGMSQDGQHPWIVALTANSGKETEAQCLAAGMNDYLTKPLRLEFLRDALECYEEAVPVA